MALHSSPHGDLESLRDPERLRKLVSSDLLDSEREAAFDRLTDLACKVLKVPVSLVSLVTDERQFFKSACGLPEPWATRRETFLSHSFCQYAVARRKPFVINDAREDPLVRDNGAVTELSVIAYLGIPLITNDGHALGAFCAIDTRPRIWSPDDIAIMTDLGEVVLSEIRLREHILEQRQAKAALAESEERLALILNSTGEGLYGTDRDGVCTFFNRACLRLLGMDETTDLVGKNMHDLIHHTRADGSPYPIDECPIRKSCRMGDGVRVDDEVFWRADGSPFSVEYWSYPIVRDGERIGAVVTFVDITERKQKEVELRLAKERSEIEMRQAAYADRQKTRFLANVSHEIRTPMNALLGFSELLEQTVDSPKAKQYVAAIRNSGSSLLMLINDILDLSKIESGKLEIHPEPCDIREAIESVKILLSQQAAEKNLELSGALGPEVPEALVIDRLRLRQILLNLLSNAVKFTRQGSVQLRAWSEKRPLDEKHIDLYIAVSDTGPGIPEDELKAIFNPFRQVESSSREAIEQGSGLGLSIAQRLASLMNGRIVVDSALGEGSTFTLVLENVEVSTNVSIVCANSAGVQDLDLLVPSTLLFVDDNPFNRELVAGYFEGTHHAIHFARNGAEALDMARQLKPDVILMDIRMPVMDGVAACKEAKRDPELSEIPTVAVTASSMKEETRRLKQMFDGYIRKPFSRAELYAALAEFLDDPSAKASLLSDHPNAPGERSAARPQDLERWRALSDQLESLLETQWKSLQRTMAIGEITEFAKTLRRLGHNAGYKPLVTYADTLHSEAEGFALTKLEATMDALGSLVETLRDSVRP